MEAQAPDAAALARRCARDPLARSLVPARPTWDAPHRLLAAVRWLVLAGEVEDYRAAADPWPPFKAALAERREWVERFVGERTVQTNEVQRCFALLPIFLTVARAAGQPLDLLELGTSAGLNLLFDRYRYRYRNGAWGDAEAELELAGEESRSVPPGLLRQRVAVRRRRGVDLAPVDACGDDGVRLLLAFASDDEARVERLRAAVGVLRREPPELVHGDYLELLPELLRERRDGVLTVVFQTLSSVYLSDAGRARLRALVARAGEDGPLAWISTPTPEEHGQRRGDYPLELTLWPGGEPRIVARMDNRGERLEWCG